MGGCSAAWAQRVQTEILSKYPNILVVQARAYERPHEVDTDRGRVTIPGIVRPSDGGFPLNSVKKFLAAVYDPQAPAPSIVIQYHPLGGFSYTTVFTA